MQCKLGGGYLNRKVFLSVLFFLYVAFGIAAFVLYENPSLYSRLCQAVPAGLFVSETNAYLSPREVTFDAAAESEAESGSELYAKETASAETEASTALSAEQSAEASAEVSTDQGTDVAEPDYTYTASHSTGRLFIRNGPSLDYETISFMRPGTTGDVISIGDEWVLLKYGDVDGYVFKSYLTLTPKEEIVR